MTSNIIGPRELLRTGGISAVIARLAETDYIVQKPLVASFENALRLGKPLLVDGAPGVGKTALAEALADAFHLPLFHLQGVEDLTLEDVLARWDHEAQNQWKIETLAIAKASGEHFDLMEVLGKARAEVWTKEFLILGEVAAAYEYSATTGKDCVLLVDEADKLQRKIHNMMLGVFARGVARIPRYEGRIGTLDQTRWPIVIVTSNAETELSAPLKSRCIYACLPRPTLGEELVILARRVKGANPKLVANVGKLIAGFRRMPGFRNYPGIRESIDFLNVLVSKNVREITVEELGNVGGIFVKQESDLSRFQKRENLEYLLVEMRRSNAEVEQWLAAVA